MSKEQLDNRDLLKQVWETIRPNTASDEEAMEILRLCFLPDLSCSLDEFLEHIRSDERQGDWKRRGKWSWKEKAPGAVCLRIRTWDEEADGLEHRAYRDRLRKLREFVRDRVADQRMCGVIVLTLTHQERGRCKLYAPAAEFLQAHFEELIAGAEVRSSRHLANHLAETWGIQASHVTVDKLMRKPRTRKL